jgi:hypothetical protein
MKTSILQMLICSDFNINYLKDNKKKQYLNYILQSSNLHSVVNFPTRISTTTLTLIDNIFIDITKLESYTISLAPNGLSDHDGQLLFLYQEDSNCTMTNPNYKIMWLFNNSSLDEFKHRLSFETWENVFNIGNNNIDNMFNTFTNTYLQIFHACFQKKKRILPKPTVNYWN